MLTGYQKGHPVRLQPVFEDKKRWLGPLYSIMVIKWHHCGVTWEALVSYQSPGIVQVNLSILVLSKRNQVLTLRSSCVICDPWELHQ